MNYLGICDNYGNGKVMLAAAFMPVAINASLQTTIGGGYLDNYHIYTSSHASLLYGMIGFTSGAVAHMVGNNVASRYKMGMTRGSAFVKKAQAVAYAVPVSLGIAFNLAADGFPGHDEKESVAKNEVQHESSEINTSQQFTFHENNCKSSPPRLLISPRPSAGHQCPHS